MSLPSRREGQQETKGDENSSQYCHWVSCMASLSFPYVEWLYNDIKKHILHAFLENTKMTVWLDDLNAIAEI